MSRIVLWACALGHAASKVPPLKWRTEVGCHHWGPGCWTPGFTGTDSSPTAGPDGYIAIASYNSNVYSVDPATGDVRWKVAGGGESSPFVTSDNRIFIPSYTSLLSLGGATGKQLWEWKIPNGGSIANAGAIDEQLSLIFVGGLDGNMYAVDLSNGTTRWTYAAGGQIWSSLGSATVKDMVCFGVGGNAIATMDCKAAVHCIDRSNGKFIWKQRTGIQIQDRPAYSQPSNQLYVGDYDGRLYAFDADTGAMKWKTAATGGRLEASPSIFFNSNGTEVVIIGSADGNVYGFDGADGKVIWKTLCGIPLAHFWSAGGVGSTVHIVANANGGGVAYSGGHGITALDVHTGAIHWHYDPSPAAEFGSSPYVTVDGSTLVAGGEDGYLYGFDLKGASSPFSDSFIV